MQELFAALQQISSATLENDRFVLTRQAAVQPGVLLKYVDLPLDALGLPADFSISAGSATSSFERCRDVRESGASVTKMLLADAPQFAEGSPRTIRIRRSVATSGCAVARRERRHAALQHQFSKACAAGNSVRAASA